MGRSVRIFGLVAVLLAISGCGPVKESLVKSGQLEQIPTMTTAQLEDEYARISRALSESTTKLFTGDEKKYLGAVGRELARRRVAELSRTLDQSRVDGNAPLADLSQVEAQSARISVLDQPTHEQFVRRLNQERQRTIQKRNALISQASSVLDESPIEALDLRRQALALSEGSAEAENEFQTFVNDLSARIYQRVEQAIGQDDWARAQSLLELVATVNPDYPGITEQLAQAETKVLADALRRALMDSDYDRARGIYARIGEMTNPGSVYDQVQDSARVLVDYLDTMATEQAAAGKFLKAKELFAESNQILDDYNALDQRSFKQTAFLDQLFGAAKRAMRKKEFGVALGLLFMIEDLHPGFPRLAVSLREVEGELVESGVRRFSTVPFSSSGDQNAVGRALASKVTQYLFNNRTEDLRIVERDTIEEILREQEIRALQGMSNQINLAAADYLLQGNVVEASIESAESNGKKTQRVVTGQRNVANPEYTAWLQLSNNQREKLPRPPATITEPVKEDITYGVTIHRKVGVMAVAFRVVEAKSTKVIYADTVNTKQEYNDTSSEGVSLGDFEIPLKIASPPSDAEVMEKLTEQSSAMIGQKILEAMAEPEIVMAKQAASAVSDGNYPAAAELIGKAYVLAKIKSGKLGLLRESVLEYASMSASSVI